MIFSALDGKQFDMELNLKRKLYMKDKKVIREYNAKDIVNIDGSGVLFADGFSLDFMECGSCFPIKHPYGNQYIGARFTGAFWQFFVKDASIVVLCNDTDETIKILSHVGFSNSYDLS